jgi:hypothetical protein
MGKQIAIASSLKLKPTAWESMETLLSNGRHGKHKKITEET